ncbi:MAG: hypothetical protein K2Y28_12665 [Burkholderiaceae bacterium]|nr:hypothetical protein [Burkholderiaceae bacterium]
MSSNTLKDISHQATHYPATARVEKISIQSGRVLRPGPAAEYLSIGLSTFWLKSKTDPTFPKLFKTGPRTTVVYLQALDEYLAAAKLRATK